CYEVIPSLSDVQDGEGRRSLTAREHQCSRAAFECRQALLEDILCRVLDARVDVAELSQCEQVRRVVRVVEDIRGGLVDRCGTSLGDGVGCSAGVDLLGLETP